jgi:hypothetical protein
MNARRLVLATVVSLFWLGAGVLLAAPAALAEELCPNAASRQGPSNALPDCRAYEQVTPVNKGDSQDLYPSLNNEFGQTLDQGIPSEDGDHFLLRTESPLTSGDSYQSSFVFSRGAEGWTTTSLSPGPGVHNVHAELAEPSHFSWVASEDVTFTHPLGQLEEQIQSTVVGPPGGPYTTAGSSPYRNPSFGYIKTYIGGASADLSHVVFESENHELAPGASGEDTGLDDAIYEWTGGQLRLVNVATNGSLLSPCGATLGEAGASLPPGGTQDSVSSDGSKIFFDAPDVNEYAGRNVQGPGCWNYASNENPPQLYMRLDGATTVLLSKPNTGVPNPEGPQLAIFVGASSDGSKVFFMSTAELTADDTTHAMELYEYNSEAPEGERLIRVSSGESGTAEGDVQFVAGMSSDSSTVYFSAFRQLAQGAPAPANGAVDLYRYDTATRKTTYIAMVDATDYPSGGYNAPTNLGYRALATDGGWYVTPDGRYLVFTTSLPLTGFDNKSVSGVQCPREGTQSFLEENCLELFRYSAADNSIVCVSCFGAAPISNAMFGRDALTSPGLPSVRPISEDGSYVFFDTASALLPNATSGMLHVYEWHNGTISLISTPDDPGNAYFQGTSADGSNVFFGTHAQLVAQDTDVDGDLYDARIDGGFVKVTPSLCTGTGCQGVPAAPPIFATPSSVTFEGVGNFEASTGTSAKSLGKPGPKPKKCKRGFVKKHGRCVKQKAKKSAKGRK